MRVSLTTYAWSGDVEPMEGVAGQLGALVAAAEARDALVPTGGMPTGVWR